MVTVRYTETYDLSTQIDKMGLIGIHTPSLRQLELLYPGLITNYKFLHVDSCDVVCACASVLPADPLQVGTEAGDIAPQDLFNPILYTAVSNDSFNTVVNRLNSLGDNAVTVNGSINAVQDAFPSTADIDAFDVYYSVLASQDRWKKAMPQQGFSMNGLYPIVYHMLSTYGATQSGSNPNFSVKGVSATGVAESSSSSDAQYLRGNACRMPRIPLHVSFPQGGLAPATNGSASIGQALTNNWNAIARTYVAAVLLPPAKMHKLYYRMRVTWTFTFEEVVPVTEYIKLDNIATKSQYFYASDYEEQSKMMDKKESSVDVKNVDMELIMTAGK